MAIEDRSGGYPKKEVKMCGYLLEVKMCSTHELLRIMVEVYGGIGLFRK